MRVSGCVTSSLVRWSLLLVLCLMPMPVLAQEIEVSTIANVDIPDGAPPATGLHTNFGTIGTASSRTRTFRLHNLSNNTTLTINFYFNPDGTNWGFGTASFIVGPNSFGTFEVIFHPTTPGLKTVNLSIANNDANESSYVLSLQGSGSTFPIALPDPDLSVLQLKPIKTKLNKKTGLIDAKLKLQVSNLGTADSTTPTLSVAFSGSKLIGLPALIFSQQVLKPLPDPVNGKVKKKNVNMKITGLPNANRFVWVFASSTGDGERDQVDNVITDSYRGVGP